MKFLTQAQFTEMWNLQDSLNAATSGADWKEKNQNWNLAIKAEIVEFFDYVGWKWWKEPSKTRKPTDMQARLELVDIWHFLLSKVIENCAEDSQPQQLAFDQITYNSSKIGAADAKLEYLERVDHGNCSLVERIHYLSCSILACHWTWDELYKAYIGKVALNNFRQANGYKEGTYQKIWGHGGTTGKELEDNWYLETILEYLSLTEGALTYQAVYHKLELEYMLRTTE